MASIYKRTRDAAVILLLAACGAAAFYFFLARRPSEVYAHAAVVVSQTKAEATQRAQHARSITNSDHPGVDGITPPSTVRLDGMAIASCYLAFRGSRPINRGCAQIKHEDQKLLCQQLVVKDAIFNQTMRGEAAACPSSLATASGYYNALRTAAQAGDVSAQQCFIRGYFDDPADGDHITQEQRDDYKRLANDYISSGLERGDWGLVRWLSQVSLGTQDSLLFSAYPFGSSAPETLYKMNLLLTLGGATDGVTERPQSVVKYFSTSSELSEQQIQEAQEWARDTYSKYFAATPVDQTTSVYSFCQSPDPSAP